MLEKQIVNTDGIKELLPELKRIRDVVEQVLKAQGKWMAHERAFGW